MVERTKDSCFLYTTVHTFTITMVVCTATGANPEFIQFLRVKLGFVIYFQLINDAMSHSLDDKRHTPEKISFKYLKHSISDMSQQVERRKGTRYTVSPFQLLINDGN